jgi:enterochelin esterase family protein
MRYRAAAFVLGVVAVIVLIGYVGVPVRAPGASTSAGMGALQQIVAGIDAGTRTSPIVNVGSPGGSATVTFLAKADGKNVPRIVSDVTGWGERKDGGFDFNVGRMTRIEGTTWYSLAATVEPQGRIEYLIAYGTGDYRLDPHNPRKVQRVGGPASEIVMPDYVVPPEFTDPPVEPAGIVTETVLDSAAIGNPRRVIMYTPPGYTRYRTYPLAVFHDGGLMVNSGEAPRVLDWLIAHHVIEPIVAAFVDPKSRTDDFRRGAPMRAFVVSELLPWIAARYPVTNDPGHRAIIGVSAGARGALDTATGTAAFNRVGLLIPALDQADVDAIPRSAGRRLRLSIVAARYDTLNIESARAAETAAIDRGHSVDYIEVPEGHSTATWRTHLRTVLIGLFGPNSKKAGS